MVKAPAPQSLEELAEQMTAVGVSVRGDPSAVVTGLTEDSRRIGPGDLFVARGGLRHEAGHFIDQAKALGASALLCHPKIDTRGLPALVCEDVRGAFGAAAQALAGHPSQRLPVVGITGTNGKTTTLTLVSDALGALSRRVATLGTLGFVIDGVQLAETLTTPQPDTLAGSLLTALQEGVDTCVMEVSSHALSQKRVSGVRFEVAAFSNLSQDHLDFHATMEEYAEAKASLFDMNPRHSVINVADPFGKQLASRHPGALTVSRLGDDDARLTFFELSVGRRGISAGVRFDGKTCRLSSQLVGTHNADNLLLALGILLSLGVELEPAAAALSVVKGTAGRLQRCDEQGDDLLCLVDYAHTPDALVNVLAALRSISQGHLICVFGCGGDRDRSKRAPMGEAAAAHADEVWVTTDNPRTEDPEAIIADIRPGLSRGEAVVHEELDRKRAIHRAIVEAAPGSVVAICGKGHETYQLVLDEVRPFDDRVEARAALRARRGERRI